MSDFEYLHWWRLHSLCGQFVPVFDHSHRKKCGVKIEFCMFYCMSIACCPVNEQCLLFCPSHQVLTDTDELPCPESSPLRLQSHSSLNLFSLEKCVTALILLALCWTHSSRSLPLMVWETSSGHCTPDGTSSVQSGEEPVVHQDPLVLHCKAALLRVGPQPIPGTWGFPLQQQDLAFPLTDLCENLFCP